MHLLVVDPDVAFATLLTEELERLGHEVTMCTSGGEAYARARQRMPDLALLDMGLSDPDAVALARRLRSLRPTVRLMVIPIVGEEPALGDNGLSIQGVLPKPFFLPELPDRIESALSTPLPGDHEGDVAAVAERVGSNQAVADGACAGAAGDRDDDARDSSTRRRVDREDGSPSTKAPSPIIAYEAFRRHADAIGDLLRDLVADIGADVAVLTSPKGVLASAGALDDDEMASISTVVLNSWETSAQMARILGREQLRFEQSIAGGSYLLYALSIHEAILAVTVSGSAPLGLLRHRARAAGEQIAQLCTLGR